MEKQFNIKLLSKKNWNQKMFFFQKIPKPSKKLLGLFSPESPSLFEIYSYVSCFKVTKQNIYD